MRIIIVSSSRVIALFLFSLILFGCTGNKVSVTPEEARTIAREAYIYGFPLVDNYRILYTYCVDTGNAEYKAPFNKIRNLPKVFTPEDKAIQTPNSDTPYSMAALDLRAEPMVLTIPPIEKERYFSVQFVDAYTFNFAYLGSRTSGNEGGVYLIAGPGWKDNAPEGLTGVIRSETDIVFCIYRTQLFNPEDLNNVIEIQKGYTVQTLSEYLGQAPKTAPGIQYLKPLTVDDQKKVPEFFNQLNFMLGFCPVNPSEIELMARFAKLGIGAGKEFDAAKLSPGLRQSISDGINDAWKELDDFQKTSIATGKVVSGDLFGTREHLRNNYLYRFAAAVLGIYGNSTQEAIYPIYKTDESGQPLDGSSGSYTLHFAAGQLPPVNAFWSLTMYELPSSLLVPNPINRYLINSPMLPGLKRDKDNGLTIYIQNQSPGKDKESNWLPAPDGPFTVVMRLYWPKEDALNGTWKNPPVRIAE